VTDDSGSSEERGERRRLYTLAEATAALALVRPLLEELSESKRGLDAVHSSLLRLTPHQRENGHRLNAIGLEQQMERLVDHLARGIREIEVMGIELKDIDAGLIDFPSLHRGRIVYLCWRLGEDEISFWHEISTGFAGRRPISDFDGDSP
jgi:hypothetical protein